VKRLLACATFAVLSAASAFAVGPTVPARPKQSGFDVTGTTIGSPFTLSYSLQGSCPLDYEETVLTVFVNQDIGAITVRVPEGIDLPGSSECVRINGMLLPSCHDLDGVPLPVVTNISTDSSCETSLTEKE
jgi:hypothetical protein